MPFSKNDLNINKSGRPKAETISDHAEIILKAALKAVKTDIKNLSSTQLIKLIGVLMPYTMPRLQAVEFAGSEPFDKLSDEQLEVLINQMLDKYNGRNAETNAETNA